MRIQKEGTMLDFRTETFLEACRTMNFTQTAKRLHITQPAVSQHIHILEQFYKTKLFAYEGRKLRLTEEGELLYAMLSVQKHDTMYMKEKLAFLKDKKKSLRFGVTLTIGEFVIAGALKELLKEHPGLSVRIVTANTRELLGKIDKGEIEFAVMEGDFPKREYASAIFSRESFIPVCGNEYKFATPLVERLEDLKGERLIIREEGSGTREVLVKNLKKRMLSIEDFENVIEIGNMSAIKSMLSFNCGISFLYEAAVLKELKNKELCRIQLKDFEVVHDFSFVWQKDSFFEEDYKEIFAELQKSVNK